MSQSLKRWVGRGLLLAAAACLMPACGRNKQAAAILLGEEISTTALPNATVNVPYSFTLQATGGNPPYLWTLLSGSLPSGIILSPSTGVISGTAVANGSFSFLVRLTDSTNTAQVRSFTLIVTGGAGGGLALSTATLPSGTVGAVYNGALSANGGTPPYTYVITSGSLPVGLTLQGSTGVIQGTPTTATGGASSITFQVNDSLGGTASGVVSFTINAAPSITTTTLPGGEVGVAYSQPLATSGGTSPLVFSVTSGALPGGLTLDGSSGSISGSPTSNGTFNFTATVMDAAGATASQALSIVVASDPVITDTSLPGATIGTAYSFQMHETGGTGAGTWSLASGTMPPGAPALGISGTGLITGTPNGSNGFYSFDIKFVDGDGKQAIQPLSISVTGAAVSPLAITTSGPLPSGDVGVNYLTPLSATGGTPPYTFTVAAGPALPAGLTLSSGGVISGVPTASAAAVTVNFKVADSVGTTPATAGLAITINPVVSFTTPSLAGGDQTVAYNQLLAASGGSGAYTFSIISGNLPAGLTLNGAAGSITGTPSGIGTSTFTLLASDGLGGSASKALSIVVNPPVSVTTSTLPAWTLNLAGYNSTLAAAGGSGVYTWAQTGGTLPPGIALSTAGALTGKPTSAGTYNFTVTATDTLNGSASAALKIVVNPAISVPSITLAPWTVNSPGYSQPVGASGGTGALTFTVTGGTVPAGLTLSAGGVLSGTPTPSSVPVTDTFTATATDAVGATGSGTIQITINAMPTITDASALPNGDPNVAYTHTFTPSGGTGALTWSISAGAAPTGLSMTNTATGVFSGTTAVSGAFSFTVKVVDSTGSIGTKVFSLTINNPITVITSALPSAEAGVAIAGTTFTASGGTGTYNWSTAAAPPATMTLTAGGLFSGTPAAAGTTPITFIATDGLGGTGSVLLNLVVAAPVTITGAVPPWTQGQAYNTVLTASSGVTPFVWANPTGLPAGITFTKGATTLTLSGTATVNGSFPLTIKVTDAVNGTFTVTPTLVINPAVTITGSVPTAWNRNTAFPSTVLTPTPGTSPFTWTVSGLPPGMNTVPATGNQGPTLTIGGTPTTKGNYTISVTVTDQAGSTSNQMYPVQINDPLVFVGTFPSFWDLNAPFTPTIGAQGGTPPYTWIATGPAGLTAAPGGTNNATLAFTGSPNTPGGSAFNITLKDSATGSISQTPAITINPALVMNGQGAFPLHLDQNAPFAPVLTASGGTVTGPVLTGYNWTVGVLPTGLGSGVSGTNNTTLTFSGPTTAATGAYGLTITLTDQGGGSVTFSPTLNISSTLSISGTFPVGWDAGATFSQTLNAIGGFGTYTWTYSNVPPGITGAPVSGGTGTSLVFSGAPTTPNPTPAVVNITLTDQAGGTATFNPPITINPALGHTGTVVSPWDANFNYNQTLSATGGTGTYTWTVTGGTGLPAGINKNINGVNNVNLQLVGAPTTASTATFNINLSDQGGGSLIIPSTLVINAALTMAFPFPAAWDQNAPFSPAVSSSGGTGPNTWVATGLPAGVTFNTSTGAVGGAPTATGPFSVQIKVTDNIGNSITNNQAFTVNPQLSGITSSLPTGTTNSLYGATLQVSGGTPNLTWAINSGGLPTGIGLNTSTGAISGTPTVPPGTYPVTFKVTDQGGGSLTTGPLNVVLNGPITLTPAGGNLGGASVGNPYGPAVINVSGGVPPYQTINVIGSTPGGLGPTIGAGNSSVTFSGTPTGQGVYAFQIKAIDSLGAIAVGNFNIPVTSASTAGPLVLSPANGPLTPGDQNSPYMFQFTGTGGNASAYSFSVTAGVNPFGLGFNTAGTLSGTLSGTPGTSPSFTVTLSDGVNTPVSGSFTLTMNAPLALQPIVLPVGDAGVSYFFQALANGGTTPITWSLLGAVPPGISMNAATGQITGSTGSTGTFQVQVQVIDNTGSAQNSGSLALTFNSPPTITTTSISGGTQGSFYTTTINATGGTGSYTWGVTGAPSGITMAPSSGILSGTTTAAAGTYPLTVTVTDQVGGSGTFKPNLVIAPGPLTITSTSLPGADAGHPYSQQIQFYGGTGPYTFTTTVGSPAPLTVDPGPGGTPGLVHGTPVSAGTISFTVKVTDSTTPTAETATQALSILVGQPPTITNTLLPAGQANQFYSAAINVSGGASPLTFSQTAGTLPTGITLNTTTGVVAGTTSSVGNVSGLQFTVTDSVGVSTNQTYTLTINPQLGNQGNFSIGQIRIPDAVVGQPYTGNVYVTQSNGTHFTYQVVDTGLLPPGGMVMNTQAGTGANNLPNAGQLTGTPSQAGEFTFTVMATDGGGNVALGNVLLVVLDPQASPAAIPVLAISTTSLTAGTAYTAYPITQLQATGGRPPYTWGTTGRNGLPFGLSLTQDGILYGNPAQSGTFTLDFFVSDASSPPQFVPKSLSLVISAPPSGFKITSTTVGPATVGTAISPPIQLQTSGGTAPITFIADTRSMEIAGLSFSPLGAISGTPTVTGQFSFPMGALDSSATTQFAGGQGSLTINPPAGGITVTTLAVPPVFFGQTYDFQFTATGGSGSYTWSVVTPTPSKADSLPSDMQITATGHLQYPIGTPSNNGNNQNNVVFQVTDGPHTTQFLIDVEIVGQNNNNSLSFNAPNLAQFGNGTLNQAYQFSEGNGGFNNGSDNNWTLLNGFPGGFAVAPIPPAIQPLVAGLTLDPARGLISGTPNVPGHFTLHMVTQEFGNNNGNNNNTSVSSFEDHALLDIMPSGGPGGFQIVTRILPPGREGVAYGNASTGDSSILIANGAGGYAFTIPSGSLPPGLTLDPVNGIVTGTPTQSGTYSCVVQVSQTGGATTQMHYDIPIVPALPFGVFTPRLPNAMQGQLYSAQLYGAGASGAVTWTDAGSATTFASLGLTLSASGAVTGTPTASLASGVYTIFVKATNGANSSIRPVTLLVMPVPINVSGFLAGKVGSPISTTLAASGGSGNYTYSFAPGVIPNPGMGLSGVNNATLGGTPTAVTTFRDMLILITDNTTGRLGYGSVQGANLSPNLPTLSFQPQIGGGGNSIQVESVLNSSNYTFGAQGGTPNYSFGDTPKPPAGATDIIPPGLATVFTPGPGAQGQLQGTPTETGFFTYWMRVTDSASATADLFLDLPVTPFGNGGGPSNPFAVSTSRVPDGIHTASSYPATQLNFSYPSSPSPTITWTAVSGMPNGNWSLSTSGVLSANASTAAGTYFIIVHAFDGTNTVPGRVKVVID